MKGSRGKFIGIALEGKEKKKHTLAAMFLSTPCAIAIGT